MFLLLLLAGCTSLRPSVSSTPTPESSPVSVFAGATLESEIEPFTAPTPPNSIRIVVTSDDVDYYAEVSGSGAVTISDTYVQTDGVSVIRQRAEFSILRPFPVEDRGPVATLVPSLVNTDMPPCDEVDGSSCIAWRGFDIDHRCYSRDALTEILAEAGWPTSEWNNAITIAMAESSGCADAIDSGACGLFGIHWIGHVFTGWDAGVPEHPEYQDKNCYNAVDNARLAYDIQRTDGWGHWATSPLIVPRLAPTATLAPVLPTARPTVVTPVPVAPTSTPMPTRIIPTPAPPTPTDEPTRIPPTAAPHTRGGTSARTPVATPAPDDGYVPPPPSIYDVTSTPVVFGEVIRLESSSLSEAAKMTLGYLGCQWVQNVANGGGWLCVNRNGVDLQPCPIPATDHEIRRIISVHPYADCRWFDREAVVFGLYAVHISNFGDTDNVWDVQTNAEAAKRQLEQGQWWRWPWNRIDLQP